MQQSQKIIWILYGIYLPKNAMGHTYAPLCERIDVQVAYCWNVRKLLNVKQCPPLSSMTMEKFGMLIKKKKNSSTRIPTARTELLSSIIKCLL